MVRPHFAVLVLVGGDGKAFVVAANSSRLPMTRLTAFILFLLVVVVASIMISLIFGDRSEEVRTKDRP